MVKPEARRCLVYARISLDKTGAGLGVDRQRADCEELAARLGWTVAGVHTDNDTSAYSGRVRPGYRALCADLAAGVATAVVAWHPDRLHRSPVELESFIDLCEAHGVVTHTVRAGLVDLSTPTGRMQARIVGAVARHESEHKSDRIRRARLQAATAGKPAGSWRPFGYEADKTTPRPDEAAELVQASERLLAGSSLRGIARDWNARGVATSRGGRWVPETVKDVLVRPRNAGLSAVNGEVVGQAVWPAVVAEDTWRAVVARLDDPARRTSPGNARKHLLSGLARCGVCGQVVRVAGTAGKRKGTLTGHGGHLPRYRCVSGSHVSRQVAFCDELVTDAVLGRLSRPDAADLLAQADDGVQVAAVSAEALTVRTRLDDLAAAFADGEVTRPQLAAGTERLRTRLANLDAILARAATVNPLAGIAGAVDPAASWDGLDLSRRQAVIDALMTVTIEQASKGRLPGGARFDPATVRIEWRR